MSFTGSALKVVVLALDFWSMEIAGCCHLTWGAAAVAVLEAVSVEILYSCVFLTDESLFVKYLPITPCSSFREDGICRKVFSMWKWQHKAKGSL